MQLENLIDYTCFYFYLCKMFLKWDFRSNYYQKGLSSEIKNETKYYIALF